MICAGVLLWRLSSQSPPHTETAAPSAPETAFAQASRDREGLTANVSYNRTLALVRVENRDAFNWNHCQLSLNAHGVSSGYLHEVESIAPGVAQAALIGSADFIGETGRPFDAAREAVATLEVACDTPQGPLSYGGRFTPP